METSSAPARLRALPSWLLNQAALPAQRLVSRAFGALGSHRHHYSVLSALDESGPASQADLGRRCGIDRSDMVALLNQLAADGLVARSPDPTDRRRNVVSITGRGRRRLRELDEQITRVQHELLAPLAPADRKRLVQMLTVLVDHHATHTPA